MKESEVGDLHTREYLVVAWGIKARGVGISGFGGVGSCQGSSEWFEMFYDLGSWR
jgi:hypothetical protein